MNRISEESVSYCEQDDFGKRSQGCGRPANQCLALDRSDMIGIDCPHVQRPEGSPNHRNYSSPSLQRSHSQDIDPQYDLHGRLCRMSSDSGLEQRSDGGVGVRAVGGLSVLQEPFARGEQHLKRNSRASDSSSAYSGSDMMHSSMDDPNNPEADLTGLMESVVDSDEEEGYAESTESGIRDTVRDCLEKDASERTDDDIEILMDFMQHFRAFASLSHMTRKALCHVMVFAVVPHEGTTVMKDGEELDSWSVILNGWVEVSHLDGTREHLQMGDGFGITPTMQKMYHKGKMVTLTDDCQFVCIAQQDYYRILHQEEENTRKHEEQGQVVMVTEHREFDGGNRIGHIVIRGTAERLMQHLVEDHSTLDPTYVEDFLLAFRSFLPNPSLLADRLLTWFNNPTLRPKVTRVVLFWVNNHFNDFETNPALCEFLEHFECLLERERMVGQMSLLNMACAAKARTRTVTLTRASRDEVLPFSILGGQERGQGIFITKVAKDSKAAEEGLKRGDQILEVNGHKFTEMFCSKALEILRGTTHLSLSVKSNLQDFKEMLKSAEKAPGRKVKREENTMTQMARYRLSVPDLDTTLSYITTTKTEEKKSDRKGLFSLAAKPRIKKALEKMNILPAFAGNSINHSDESLNIKPSRKSSTSSSSSSITGPSNHLSASNPDLSTLTLGIEDKAEFPEHVIKIFRADQSFKFLLIHKETTAKEVVMLALQEFGVTECSGNFSLCEVTVESENFIKRRRLPDQLNNLPERLNLKGRFYLKNNMSTEPLIPDDMIGELLKESQILLLQLNATEVAWQLTLEDFKVFKDIEPTEYIDELFEIHSKYGCPMIRKFAELVNREMFWVVTEICGEPNVVKRMKLIKHFIKIAKCCKDYKNFNSMFAILSGLGHGSVSRLRSTWEKLPNKYCRMFQDLETLMDPSRNMAKYRNLLNSEHIQPPVIPIFPVVKKDLTFIHLGNDSYVEGLVNFEKLRMIAKEIRHTTHFCSSTYSINSSMLLSTQSMFSSSLVSGMATLRRTKYRRGSTLPNPKKMYEEAQMVRKVRSYLSTMPANTNEEELADMSNQCEPPPRKRDTSPGGNSPNLEEKRAVPVGPKFGTESPGAVRKIMALTDKVRPHNPKVPVPAVTSPRRQGPPSPRQAPWAGGPAPQCRLLPVRLTQESSSVSSVLSNPPRRSGHAGSVGSIEQCVDGDSALGSSSSMDHPHPHPHPAVHVSGPLPSAPSHQWTQPGMVGPASRPLLPSYTAVMHNAGMSGAPVVSNHAVVAGYPPAGRPPLPDYQSATHMAQLVRHKHSAVGDSSLCCQPVLTDGEEEQVSAV
ncbi:rap guanine nucleotide exchange factor 2-like [Babylonia areolata]|uniref:rap guanine nucleotide exchange factor 2-like n=1 Tax=Babylonia areolata TaxID=304850 RepID=UPI003FD2EF9B